MFSSGYPMCNGPRVAMKNENKGMYRAHDTWIKIHLGFEGIANDEFVEVLLHIVTELSRMIFNTKTITLITRSVSWPISYQQLICQQKSLSFFQKFVDCCKTEIKTKLTMSVNILFWYLTSVPMSIESWTNTRRNRGVFN